MRVHVAIVSGLAAIALVERVSATASVVAAQDTAMASASGHGVWLPLCLIAALVALTTPSMTPWARRRRRR